MPKLVKDEALVYSAGDCLVTPYPTESTLARAYLRLEEENLLEQVFHEGVPGIGWFINAFTKDKAILACWYRYRQTGSIGQDLDLCGFTWFNAKWKIGTSNKFKAEVGIAFFKAFHKPKITLPCAALSTEWAFDNLGIDAMFGTTPEPNRAACLFFRRLGWKSVGPIEGYSTYPGVEGLVGIYSSFMTKERWASLRSRWFD